MTQTLVTPPAAEPVSVADAKLWLKAEGDDAVIASLITTARQAAEDYTGKAFVTQTWRQTLDGAVRRGLPGWLPAGTYQLPVNYFDETLPKSVVLLRRPVQSVASVSTCGPDGTVSPFAGYRLSGGEFVLTGAWPSGLREYDPVEITYLAGYGTPSQVPGPIKTAILMGVQALYEGRATDDLPAGVKTLKAGDSTITRFDRAGGGGGDGALPASALRLLAPYRTLRI